MGKLGPKIYWCNNIWVLNSRFMSYSRIKVEIVGFSMLFFTYFNFNNSASVHNSFKEYISGIKRKEAKCDLL